jgi:hypothetical protein
VLHSWQAAAKARQKLPKAYTPAATPAACCVVYGHVLKAQSPRVERINADAERKEGRGKLVDQPMQRGF